MMKKMSECEIHQRSRAGITGDNVLKYSVIDQRSRNCITKLERSVVNWTSLPRARKLRRSQTDMETNFRYTIIHIYYKMSKLKTTGRTTSRVSGLFYSSKKTESVPI